MAQYIDKAAVIAEIEKFMYEANQEADIASTGECFDEKVADAKYQLCKQIRDSIDSLEVKEVNLEKESELIANGIMIGVQANKYHTCIYNTKRCDFNHSHLMIAARKGIELGLKASGVDYNYKK